MGMSQLYCLVECSTTRCYAKGTSVPECQGTMASKYFTHLAMQCNQPIPLPADKMTPATKGFTLWWCSRLVGEAQSQGVVIHLQGSLCTSRPVVIFISSFSKIFGAMSANVYILIHQTGHVKVGANLCLKACFAFCKLQDELKIGMPCCSYCQSFEGVPVISISPFYSISIYCL